MGAVLVTLAALALVYGLSRASMAGWADMTVFGALVVAVVALILFVLAERRHRRRSCPSLFSPAQASFGQT